GAQNVGSALALKKALKNAFSYKRLFLILGVMRDKDIDGVCRELGGITNYAVATTAKTERACPPEIIKKKILSYNSDIDVITADSVAEAVERCRKQASEEDLILITGSLYVVAEAMQCFQNQASDSNVARFA
ncbi:unnamed protein product, partial [marine sediment metagenome]